MPFGLLSAALGRAPLTRISPAASGRMPASASSNSDWPLPATPAMPTISPARSAERDVLDAGDAAIVAHGQSARLQHDLAGMGGALLDLENDLAADHRVGEFGRRGFRRLESRDDFAAPHHRDAIGQAHDLAQLVGDEDDRLVLRFQHAQHRKKLVGLGRRQHGGRLVEHQDFRAADKRLEDFDALLQADRQFADDRVRVDIERVFLGQMREFVRRSPPRRRASRGAALGAEHDVFEHAERRHQHEMLVHHADAVADRLLR